MADETEAHGGAVGDTDEVHDTIHPGDLPPGHPARPVAERKLAESGGSPGHPNVNDGEGDEKTEQGIPD